MRFIFDEQKAAEAAAHLLKASGGSMPYIKLMKLMYLADRQALIETGAPITGAHMVSMPKGPVLSQVLERISMGPREDKGKAEYSPWFEYVSAPHEYQVTIVRDPPVEGYLSDYQIRVLQGVYSEYGRMEKWALVDLTHRLPEYQDPYGSSLPIRPETILRAVGKSDEEIASIAEGAESAWSIEADADGRVRIS